MSNQPMKPRNVGGCPCLDCGNDKPSTERAIQKREWHAEARAALTDNPHRSCDHEYGICTANWGDYA